jgi:membrane protein implicated in regulation of membrane protease activity
MISGFWLWLIAGMLLIAGEAFAPGVFLLWIGAAAIATGLLTAAVDITLAWSLLFFAFSAGASVLIGRRVYGAASLQSDEPFLNRRADALVGRTFTLNQPIAGGEGVISVNDTQWRLRGPDMPAGVRIRVVAIEEATFLRVEQA